MGSLLWFILDTGQVCFLEINRLVRSLHGLADQTEIEHLFGLSMHKIETPGVHWEDLSNQGSALYTVSSNRLLWKMRLDSELNADVVIRGSIAGSEDDEYYTVGTFERLVMAAGLNYKTKSLSIVLLSDSLVQYDSVKLELNGPVNPIRQILLFQDKHRVFAIAVKYQKEVVFMEIRGFRLFVLCSDEKITRDWIYGVKRMANGRLLVFGHNLLQFYDLVI